MVSAMQILTQFALQTRTPWPSDHPNGCEVSVLKSYDICMQMSCHGLHGLGPGIEFLFQKSI